MATALDGGTRANDATTFVSLIEGTVGEGDKLVTIEVGKGESKKIYSLSRKRLSNGSAYFRAAFEGPWLENQTRQIRLSDEDPLSFDLVVQFIYMNMAVLPSKPQRTSAEQISLWLRFLKLADFLQVKGPANGRIASFIEVLVDFNRYSIQASHIRDAALLPQARIIQRIFANACVGEYLDSKKNHRVFRFKEELEDIDSFAAELFGQIPITQLIKGFCSQDGTRFEKVTNWRELKNARG